jgi:hypothetical protein
VPEDPNDPTTVPAEDSPPRVGDVGAPRFSPDEQLARLTSRGTFLGLQMGATLVASVCGVLVFVLLVGAQVWQPLAAVGGLVFALIARRAVTWLLLYWLTTRGGPPA